MGPCHLERGAGSLASADPNAGPLCHHTCGLPRGRLSIFVAKVSSRSSGTWVPPEACEPQAPAHPRRQTSFANEGSPRNRNGKPHKGRLSGSPPRPHGCADKRGSEAPSPAGVCCPDRGQGPGRGLDSSRGPRRLGPDRRAQGLCTRAALWPQTVTCSLNSTLR